jgi:hypothetical protein
MASSAGLKAKPNGSRHMVRIAHDHALASFMVAAALRIWLGAALILTCGLIVVLVEHGRARLGQPAKRAKLGPVAGRIP